MENGQSEMRPQAVSGSPWKDVRIVFASSEHVRDPDAGRNITRASGSEHRAFDMNEMWNLFKLLLLHSASSALFLHSPLYTRTHAQMHTHTRTHAHTHTHTLFLPRKSYLNS